MSKGPDQHLPIGFRVKHYEIRAVLGFGGFGITYKAWDTMLERTVAVKEFLPQDLATRFEDNISLRPRPDKVEDYQFALDRFLQEARTLAKFNHPNIVRVTDFVEANGTAYLVMDYVQGMSLSAYLRVHKGRVSEDQLRAWFLPLLRGLAEVHEAGFLHRDIKPGNIYIRDRGDPILIDFGAARQAIGEQTRSVTGIFTAGYAPVEQYATDSKMQGAWTDLYSIGATLYRCISRVTPVDSPTRQATIMDEEPDPLVPAVHVARGQYSEPFLELIDKLLVIQARRRPRSTESVIEELEASALARSAVAPVPAAPPVSAAAPPPAQVQNLSEAQTSVAPPGQPAGAEEAPTEVAAEDSAEAPTEVQADTPTQLVDDLEPETISFTAVRTEPLDRPDRVRRSTARKAKPEGTGGGKGVLFAVLLLLLAAGGGGYWFLLGPGSGAAGKSTKSTQATTTGSPTTATESPMAIVPAEIEAEPVQAKAPIEPTPIAKPIPEPEPVPEPEPEEVVKAAAPVVKKAPDQLTAQDIVSGESVVNVTSSPSGAEVALNGIVIGKTPFESQSVLAGDYVLTVSHADAKSAKQQVSISPGAPLELELALDTGRGTISVSSKPAGATIELDGKRLQQKTPAVLKDIARGSHTIVLSKDRYQSSTRKVDVASGKQASQEHVLKSIPYAPLYLDVSPRDARVVLADAGVDYTEGMELPAGIHRVLVSAEGYRPVESVIELKKGLPIPAIKLRKVIPAGRFMQDQLRDGVKGPEMVVLPTGSFRMGCLAGQGCEADEMPAHSVNLKRPIAMGRYEITFADYDKFVVATGARRPGDQGWGRERRPVIDVSWNDAVAYAAWLSEQTGQKYRLPSEAEWEYGVRAGSSARYYFGDNDSELCTYANVADLSAQKVQSGWEVAACDDGQYRTAPVGGYRRNDFKLYDMHGNVWEWTQDCYYPSYHTAPADGSARKNCGSNNRVFRGGSWSDKPAFQRSTERDKATADTRGNYLGFRLVRELD